MISRTVPACAALAVLLAFPSIASSAVERTGNTFLPRSGAELVETAGIINAAGGDEAFKPTVQLIGIDYAVPSPVVFTSLSAPTIVGPTSGTRAVITHSTAAPINLLTLSSRVASATSGVSNVDFVVKGTAANTVVALDLQRGGQLRDSTVTVPASASKVTAVRLSPALGSASPVSPAVLQRVRVNSGATEAPAVRATNGSRVLDSSIRGGAPALDIAGDASGADHGNVTVDATSVTSAGTTSTVPVVRVRGGGNRLRAVLWSASIDGRSTSAAQLIDIGGPSAAAGSLAVDLGQTSLRGATSSIGVWVRAAAQATSTTPLAVDARGLLSIGSQFAVDCSGGSGSVAPSSVSVAGVWRSGVNTVRSGCSLFETGLRTGVLQWRDEAAGDFRPVWNSPLVDRVSAGGVPEPAGARDVAGGNRFVTVQDGGAPGDIGALEYQLTLPVDVTATAAAQGNRGLVALVGEARDPDEREESQLRYEWLLPDGSRADGPVVMHRFSTTEPQQVQLSVFDVTGRPVSTTTTVTPVIRPNEPATDGGDGPGPADPGDPPVDDPPDDGDGGGGGGGGGPMLPIKPIVIPVVSAAVPQTVQPGRSGPDPSLKQDFPPILKTVTAKNRRVLTNRRSQPAYARARRGEAELVIQTWRKSEMALEVSSVLEGEGMTVGLPMASVQLKPFVGRKTLRIGAKVGKRKLKPGLYQMTIAATHRPGAVPERISFFVRVLRAK